MLKGVEFTARKMLKHNSTIPLMVISYKEDEKAKKWCEEKLVPKYSKLTIICVHLSQSIPSGYGFAKPTAIISAPADEVLWMDCDILLHGKPENFFDNPHYLETGAMFWPDMGDLFTFGEENWEKFNISKELYPPKAWFSQAGFDTGMIVVNKKRSVKPLEILAKMMKEKDTWNRFSFGDKDLWHVAWMVSNTKFTMVPYAATSGNFNANGSYFLTTRPMFSTDGEIMAAHQIWTKKSKEAPCPQNSRMWNLFGENLRKINCPLYTIRVDYSKNDIGGLGVWRDGPGFWQELQRKLKYPEELFFSSDVLFQLLVEGYTAWTESIE
eukprot:TRINITY_DN10720_c0_g1_i2.p1 TRINITY_DN10720_c0_g1~~TRINITY_DN10720_c0_g1_i2.p1  ORF type:complete len:325 (-),score=50.14 TRINITY_DN10720_c0_g1_i2:165-1139(-)